MIDLAKAAAGDMTPYECFKIKCASVLLHAEHVILTQMTETCKTSNNWTYRYEDEWMSQDEGVAIAKFINKHIRTQLTVEYEAGYVNPIGQYFQASCVKFTYTRPGTES